MEGKYAPTTVQVPLNTTKAPTIVVLSTFCIQTEPIVKKCTKMTFRRRTPVVIEDSNNDKNLYRTAVHSAENGTNTDATEMEMDTALH